MSNLLLSMMGAFAEFERALIRERQLEGISIAKKNGKYKGRKKALSSDQVKALKEMIAKGDKKAAVAREFKVSRATIYHYLKSKVA